ncbi:hypothetical protein [uncultured Duncaniella sp.]|uniref:hypothetical protein n=1 Tax=uncultured Duncaniella sp. TaxID=2768039 RepID=UPI00262EE824|nr:hypothetical protein [uncultured Duncaniella sp.]
MTNTVVDMSHSRMHSSEFLCGSTVKVPKVIAQEKYEANIQKWEEEKRRVMAKLEQERKEATKSIWQRIADWFVSLWHSIFG